MRSRSRILVALALAALLAACGVKRPPAVAITPPGDSASGPVQSAPSIPDTGQPIDTGPDVQPLRDEAAAGRELAEFRSGEDGPLADVLFQFDQAVLSDEALATLQKHVQWLSQRPDVKVTIEGHCDQRGTVEYNLALGDLRAQAVRAHLESLGVAPERLVAISYGKERPLDLELSEAAWAKNRRAHFVVSP